MMHTSGLPKFLWGEVIIHTIWLKNRHSTHSLDNKTPFEMLFKKKLDPSNLPVWGCQV
ncbi:uncharacterized protein BJ212DRAFT_1287918 [Suillus subaureus]|uniref:Uncharacterized protein n=1 Tax=Suillus subaureus TaxID=48587 RepID=A0A9P7DP53_9AGAM|nr:uncharacterized protein BJ212DRAFT_1287918 [Suillus subaureus]KAG1799621.1 hypothetical protein BJ212DRAFT_1287918 [Suillus subaureus]